jgi:hypothetical protein
MAGEDRQKVFLFDSFAERGREQADGSILTKEGEVISVLSTEKPLPTAALYN